jgi:hypothetical protein
MWDDEPLDESDEEDDDEVTSTMLCLDSQL